MSELKVYIDGEFKTEDEAKISVFDAGVLYGDGIFEGLREYNERIFKLDEHIDRLFDSAKMINLDIKKTKKEIKELVIETIKFNDLKDSYIRLVVTRGKGELGLNRSHGIPTIFCIVQPLKPIANPKGIKVITSAYRRVPPSVYSPNIKSLNYLNNVLARQQAELSGAEEAILLDMNGYVSEGSADNIFIIKKGVLITPPYISSLRGITREAVFDISYNIENIGYMDERNISIFELYAADEVFITGTAAEIAPVVEADGRKICDGKPGKITLEIQRRFKEMVNTEGTSIYD